MKIKIYLILMISMIFLNLNAYHYGKNKIQYEKIEWSVIESKHFDIHYVKGQDEFGKLTVLLAENAYFHLYNFFKQPLKNRIPIIVYSSKQEFYTTNIIYPLLSEGVGGFTETLRNRVALPFDGSYKKFEEVLIHELTHAYINDIDSNIFKNPLFRNFSNYLPFWFNEGLPEYLAIKGQDTYNNMFIVDMVMNDYLLDLENLGGYFAYRLGEAILVWIAEEWNQDKITEYFYNLKVQNDINSATKKTFGYDFYELQKRFRLSLKRQYNHLLNNFKVPIEFANRHTYFKDSKAYQNIFPRYTTNGNEFVYFSQHKGRTVIKLASSMKLFEDKIIMTGERSAAFEDFHFQRNNISYFPDNKTIAFVSRRSKGDHIYFYDTETRKIINSIFFKEFDSIYEIDISPDGEKLVFSAQKNNRCDIFIYDINTQHLLQITDDLYLNSQPRWSNNGKDIAFVSERPHIFNDRSVLNQKKTGNLISNLSKDIYKYNLKNDTIIRVTNDPYDNFHPVWSSNDDKILFISDREFIANIFVIDLELNKTAKVSNVLSGVHSFDISDNDESLILSIYYDNVWEIYTSVQPLYNLKFQKSDTLETVFFKNDFHEVFNTHKYKFFGKNVASSNTKQVRETQDYRHLRQSIKQDTLSTDFFKYFSRNINLLEIPDTLNYNIPKISNYKPRLKIDSFWGGMAYSSSYGTIGMLQLGMSDLMGDHGLGISVDFNGKIEDSNLVLSYMYLPHRIDYGIAVYNFSDITTYRSIRTNNYFELKESQTGGYFLIRYPLSKFLRFDFEQSLYRFKTEWSIWNRYNQEWEREYVKRDWVYVPKIRYVFDNALYGPTGPLSGYRLTTQIKQGIRNPESDNIHFNDFTTIYTDNRAYYLIAQRFSFANRLIIGASNGKNPEKFNIKGFNGVRGFSDGNLKGDRKFLTSIELRYPFIDYLKMSFPIPMTIGNIRGSIFADVGSVWNKSEGFKGMDNSKLNDLKLGFGFGPRMNIGYFILKFDVAWSSDLVKHGKPTYYFSINEDF